MNNGGENKAIYVVKKVFLAFVFIVCAYFIVGQIALQNEQQDEGGTYRSLSEGWVWIKDDGTRTELDVPGKCEIDRNALMILENTLPDDVEDNLYLCIRSSKQEMKVYIDDELRKEYTTEDTRWFGKVSAVAWVFVELKGDDAGKNICIELQTDSSYSGVFHVVHYGDKWEIFNKLFEENGLELIIGLFMFVLGIASIIISIALKLTYKKNVEIEYLGWAVFLTAIWILANSVFRQVLFPSISTISDMAFFMVMLIAIPVMLYLNSVQGERYAKAYFVIIVISLIGAVVWTGLHITNTVDFSDTITYMGIIAGVSIAFIAFTMLRDLIKGYIKSYKMVALGILAICVAAVVQIVIYFKWTNQFSGSIMAASLVIVLVISFINTMNDVFSIEQEKQSAIISNEAKGKFLANMSHEIRTPINAILGMDTMILRECEDEDIRTYAMNIQNAGQTLLSLINDILDFSKIESGKMEIIPVEYDFSSMVHDVVNMIMMRAGDKGLKMNLSVENSLPYKLYGDEVRIRQILTNLLTNAVKYTKEGSVGLTVNGKREGEEIVLNFLVEDTGIGIKPEDIDKLFVRFERIEEERNRNVEGTGLGMSITMQLLKLMDGELEVESQYGIGSKFTFTLRQKVVSDEPIGNLDERIRNMAREYKYDVSFIAPRARVLVVDDNMLNRKVFIGLLKRSKIKIDEAESGPECLEMIKEKHYDLIFLDHMMPDMDGMETLKQMKMLDDYPCKNTPVIALTANAIWGAKEMYLEAGFHEFLSKPIQPEKLEKMIVEFLPKEMLDTEQTEENSVEESKLPNIEGIDWSIAKSHIPDTEVLMETIHNFYTTMDAEAEYLQSCYNHIGDDVEAIDNYRIKVHAMKSSAALIGAMTLSEKAKELEYAAKDENVEYVSANHQEFLDEWNTYKEKLSIFIEQKDKVQIDNKEEIITKLVALKEAIEIMDVDACDEMIAFLNAYQYSEAIQQKMDELAAAIINLDSMHVIELADELIVEI